MAYVEEALVARLEAVSGVATLVSGTSSYRIYPFKLPQNPTFSAITYNLIYSETFHCHAGSSGLRFPRFQIDAWSSGYDTAKALAEQIRLALQGYKGTIASVKITGILKDADNPDYYDPEIDVWRVSADYAVHHEETQPS